jgi:hypothetical protein
MHARLIEELIKSVWTYNPCMAVWGAGMNVLVINETLSNLADVRWTESDAMRVALAIVEDFPGSSISWDKGDEDWIQTLQSNVAICYVHVNKPLVLALSTMERLLQSLATDIMTVISVPSRSEKCLSADVELLRRVFPGYLLPDALPGRNADRFSAEELWFATN